MPTKKVSTIEPKTGIETPDTSVTIRTLLQLIFLVLIGSLALLFAVLQMLSNTQEEVAASERRRFVSFRLADELRQSSDDLTRMARMYVQTGEEHYAEHFQEILDIPQRQSPPSKRFTPRLLGPRPQGRCAST